jgi:cobalamin-dependent methionine synthase I
MVVDINLDDGLLDGLQAMQKFCKIAVTEPDVSRVRVLHFNQSNLQHALQFTN